MTKTYYSNPPYTKVLVPRLGGIMQVPAGYWDNISNIRDNLEWLIEKEGLAFDDDLPRKMTVPFLEKAGLGRLLVHYGGSPFKVMDTAYSGRYYIWQFRHNGNRIWTKEDGTLNYELARQATKWLVEEKLGLNARTSTKATNADFAKYGLIGMLYLVYDASSKKAVDDTYPYTRKSTRRFPNGFWQSEKGLALAIQTVQNLVEAEKIQIEDIPYKLSWGIFKKHHLQRIVQAVPSESHIDLIIAAYPQFKPSDFPRYRGKILHSKEPNDLEMKLAQYRVREDGTVIDLYSDEGKGIALKVARELMQLERITEEEAPTKLTKGLFIKYHILTVFKALGNNTYNVVTSLLPEQELKPWQIRPTPSGYWNGPDGLEHAAQSTRWLIEEKLGIPTDKIPQRIHQQNFAKYGLIGMMHLFNGSVYRAINNAYQNKFNEWEIRQKDMWQGEKGKELGKKAVRWLVEYSGIQIEDLPRKLTRQHFRKNGLGGCLNACFGSSLYNAISETFPEINPEQLAWMKKRAEHLNKI